MGEWPALRGTLAEAARQKRESKSRILRGDWVSADWDGGGDLSGGKDATATKGLFFDYSAGALQAEKLFAEGADITDINADNITAGTLVAARIAAGSLDGGKITAGTLTATEIKAETITTSRLVIGSFDNLIQDPGFESGTFDNYGTTDGGGTWSIDTTIPRSGAKCAKWAIGGSGTPVLTYTRAQGDINANPAAAEGDEFHFEVWVRPGGSGSGVRDIVVDIRSFDETGSSLGTAANTWAGIPAVQYSKLTTLVVCPAGTAYVVPRVSITYDAGKTQAQYTLDDGMLRRKVGTLIIEDQAVDIARMLNPVFVESKSVWNSGQTWTTAVGIKATQTITVPSWVGSISINATTVIEYLASSTQAMRAFTNISGSAGPVVWMSNINNEYNHISAQDAVTVTSPGSTIDVETKGGTDTSNQASVTTHQQYTAVGVR